MIILTPPKEARLCRKATEGQVINIKFLGTDKVCETLVTWAGQNSPSTRTEKARG